MTKQLTSEIIHELSISNCCVVACGWKLYGHPPYSPNLAPSDFHLFSFMKTWLVTQRFDDDEELHAGVSAWLKSQATTFYDDGINKLVYRYDKCLNLYGYYVQK
ncbi:hypothetical protein AVEN_18241-1 [Araneus ventricosus]|uniref:Histone-lysine N-methyltransferase SETMAR n=1 Tax=Araneus ventricosus TaxID=182803 RepID=A0A4Y2AKI4_ARAVE|nr:hypothetical protein AVEN_18241-1 [Araneus ventricosus]